MPRARSYRTWIARALAHALLTDAAEPGATSPAALRARAAAALDDDPSWLAPLVDELAKLSSATWERFELASLTERIAALPALDLAFADGAVPRVRRLLLRPASMRPLPFALEGLALPPIATIEDLAIRLRVTQHELEWLTGEAQAYREPTAYAPWSQRAAIHYRALLLSKRDGRLRLIEAPKAILKQAQRRLLDDVLNHVPAHEAAHGFVPGRSVVTHAAAHTDQAIVLRFDLADFFPSIPASRVHAVWRTLGYPVGVARALTTLCTARTPRSVLERLHDAGSLDWIGVKRHASPHLPQGAPTSPALANLCAFRLDLRLAGLARAFGATYTRYADDLTFSGPAALRARQVALQNWVAGIVADEGFRLRPDKTRVLPAHRQQRVTGVVVNVHPNVTRADFDRLKARIHQCVRQGPASQNHAHAADFRAQLLGQVAWVRQLNAARGDKLLRLFAQIDWTA